LSKNTDPKKNGYLSCVAMKKHFKNAYTFLHPADSQVILTKTETGNMEVAHVIGLNAWVTRDEEILDGRYRVLYDYSWFFFCEEPLMIHLTPPYLHKTSDREGGVITAGSFDIGRWFRPLFLDYLVWGDSATITLKKDEPACYISFDTDRRVILKQFEATEELMYMSGQVAQHKEFFPNESLNVLYERFTRSHRHKRVAEIIKNNLLE
jgi:hypothetical protein